VLAKRWEYYSCIAGIVVATTEFDRGAEEDADKCPHPMKLSYESTIVEDIKDLVSKAWIMNRSC